MRFAFFLALLCLTAHAMRQEVEIGDVVANAEMVATFEHNEPNIVVAPTGHRRHYRVVTPFVMFGDQRVDLISDGSLGFFSSYERKEAQAVILLQAKHEGANTTLGCLMPGTTFTTPTDAVKDGPLSNFKPMMTCNLQIHGNNAFAQNVDVVLDVESMQSDRVVVEHKDRLAGVVLRREDQRHQMRLVASPFGNATIRVDPYSSKARFTLNWPAAIPASSIDLQFHVMIISSSAQDIVRDEWLLLVFLAVALLVLTISIFACNFCKYIVLEKDTVRKQNQRLVGTAANSAAQMIELVSVDRLAAAQSILSEQTEYV